MARRAAKKKAGSKRAAKKPRAQRHAAPKTKPATIKTKPPTGERAEIHQDIHPVEPTPELKPR